ncbi:MAG: hypothetical protein ACW99U_18150 [Candidatus Thorarchaeota archaeon]|jgi:DNA-binding transcriptional regulator YbjK
MEVNVEITNLNERQQRIAAEVLADLNSVRVAQQEPVFTSLDEWGESIIKENLKTMIREKDRFRGEIRREAWVQATDEQRAAADAALGVE